MVEKPPVDLCLRLGKSGLKISKVILGAMSYGSPSWQEWVLNEEQALPLLEHAYKVGLNTWDTVGSCASTRAPIIDMTWPTGGHILEWPL